MALSNKFGWLVDRDRQQVGALGRLLDPLRRPGRRVRAAQGRLQDRRLPPRPRAQRRAPARELIPAVDHRARALRRAARRPARRGLAAALRGARPRAQGLRRGRPIARGALRGRLRPRRRRARGGDDRPRRVQAPPGPAGGQDPPQGVRPRPAHADHQPLARVGRPLRPRFASTAPRIGTVTVKARLVQPTATSVGRVVCGPALADLRLQPRPVDEVVEVGGGDEAEREPDLDPEHRLERRAAVAPVVARELGAGERRARRSEP